MTKKTLNYYLNQRYPIQLIQLTDNDGGGWNASIPQLGSYTFQGDGDTIETALENLDAAKREFFQLAIDRGIELPDPISENEENYSGKFVVRVPKNLHRSLSEAATENECSLNQYVVSLLSSGVTSKYFKAAADKWQQEVLHQMLQEITHVRSLLPHRHDFDRSLVDFQSHSREINYPYARAI